MPSPSGSLDLLDPEVGWQQLQKVDNYLLINMVSYPKRLEYFSKQLITHTCQLCLDDLLPCSQTSYEVIILPKLHSCDTCKQL